MTTCVAATDCGVFNNTKCVWTPICFVGYAKIGLLDVVDREDATLTYNNATNCFIEHYASYGHHALYIGGGINTKSVIEGGLEVEASIKLVNTCCTRIIASICYRNW